MLAGVSQSRRGSVLVVVERDTGLPLMTVVQFSWWACGCCGLVLRGEEAAGELLRARAV